MPDLFGMLTTVKQLQEGDYAECGFYRGASAMIIYAQLAPGAIFHIFDSFEGHAEPGEYDNAAAHPKGAYSDTSVIVARACCPTAEIHEGFIPAKFHEVRDRRFRFVNIDVDHYAPTKASIEFFLPRLVPGGIMRFDDYCDPAGCPGAVKAVNELIPREKLEQSDWMFVNA